MSEGDDGERLDGVPSRPAGTTETVRYADKNIRCGAIGPIPSRHR